jgi:outer membrane protein TolC
VKNALLLSMLVAALPAAAEGPPPKDLKSFLQAAEAYNYDQRISLEQRERAVWEFHQAWTALLPAVSASGNYTHNFLPDNKAIVVPFLNPGYVLPTLAGQVVDPVRTPPSFSATLVAPDQWDGIARADLPLLDVTRWMRVATASANREGAAERQLVMRDLVRRQVVASYYGYAAALALQESSKKSLAVADAQLKLADIRAKAGSATELELLRARAEVQRNAQVLTDTEVLVATSRRTLRTLSGVEPPLDVPLPATDTRAEPGWEVLEQVTEGLPSVRAADRDADAASRNAWGVRLALIPTVSAQGTVRLTSVAGLTGQTDAWSAGVGFTWRLDGPTLMGYGVQDHAEAAARLAAEKARLAARDQIHADWQRFNAGLQKVVAAEAQVQAATRANQVAQERYGVGAATQVDVIQAERDLFQAEAGQIQARTELATARASLRISSGKAPLDD